MSPLARAVEALLFLSPDPLDLDALGELTESDGLELQAAIAEVRRHHGEGSGLEVAEVADGLALRTRASVADVCDRLRERPREDLLSAAALETLAVVAYLGPISRPEIGKLRGVAPDAVVASLVERGLLEEAGRDGSGGAVLYSTTVQMQQRFGLRSLDELPPIESFELTGDEAEAVRRRLFDAGHLEGGAGSDG